MKNIISVTLAAGDGKRMNSNKSKVVQKIYGKSLVERSVDIARKAGISENIVVVGNKAEDIENSSQFSSDNTSTQYLLQQASLVAQW